MNVQNLKATLTKSTDGLSEVKIVFDNKEYEVAGIVKGAKHVGLIAKQETKVETKPKKSTKKKEDE